MQPATVMPINLEEKDTDVLDVNENLEEINQQTLENIDILKNNIYKFKKITYNDIVNGDKNHNAADMGALMSYHALYLQTIAFWIGLLDGRPVPNPIYESKQHQRMLVILTQKILETARLSFDARTQVYSLLARFSTQHPFEFSEKQKNTIQV
jgi:hypothetical protein